MTSIVGVAFGAIALTGCGSPPLSMMGAPVLYADGGVDPFVGLDPSLRTPEMSVFYATDRAPRTSGERTTYGNDPSDSLSLGRAEVAFGSIDSWNELDAVTRGERRPASRTMRVESIEPLASVRIGAAESSESAVTAFAREVNARLARTTERRVLVFVHGAQVGFPNACQHTAELVNVIGRTHVPVAFAWPTHQEMVSYVDGVDVMRADRSAASLRTLLEVLALRTSATRIDVASWSAGGRVVARAIADLAADDAQPRRFRIGTVFFAAPDVPIDVFLGEVAAVHAASDRVIATASDSDGALASARGLMGGDQRVGLEGARTAALEETVSGLDRFELIDVSWSKSERGFDVGGHRYWFDHPWVASDVVLALRTGRPAEERGLIATGAPRAFGFDESYPERVREAARALGVGVAGSE